MRAVFLHVGLYPTKYFEGNDQRKRIRLHLQIAHGLHGHRPSRKVIKPKLETIGKCHVKSVEMNEDQKLPVSGVFLL